MLWDEATQNMMVTLWNDEGLSASDIASRLSKHFGKELTRNSVVAKAWRLRAQGMQIRGRTMLTPGSKKKQRRGKLPRALKRNAPLQLKPAKSQLEMAMRAAPYRPLKDDSKPTVFGIDGLEKHHCRWPIGEPGAPGFGFCGQQKFMALPYCPLHSSLAFAPPQIRKSVDLRAISSNKIVLETEDA